MTTRRAVIGGAAATAVAGLTGWKPAAAAASPKPLFAGTPLAGNEVAAHFQRIDDLWLPAIPVVTADGTAPLARVGGKTRLLALWAEWCAPCLVEIRDFAAQRAAIANDRFDIGLVLTASSAKLDRDGALAKLRTLGAAALPLLVEPAGGKRVAEALASRALPPEMLASLPKGAKASSFSLPCTLLVDGRGRVRGRTFGATMIGAGGRIERPVLTEEQKAALKRGDRISGVTLTDADKAGLVANGRTMWAGAAGRSFLKALADGALDRV